MLAVFHYVVGGLVALFYRSYAYGLLDRKGCASYCRGAHNFITHFSSPPGWLVAALIVVTGKRLRSRTNYMFCLTMAGVECLFVPFGTILGVVTIIILLKEPVRKLFLNTDKSIEAVNETTAP